jgi:hypothetical protein
MERDDLIERIAGGLEDDLRLRLKQMRIDRDVLRRGLRDCIPAVPAAEGVDTTALMRSLAAIDAGRTQREVLGTMLREIAIYSGGSAIIILVGEEITAWPGSGMGLAAGDVFGSRKIPLELPENSLVARAAREAKMFVAPFPGAPGDRAVYRSLGLEPPEEIAVVPMVVRSRVQAVVLVEGRRGRPITDPQLISIIVRFTGFVIDLLPLKKKIGEIAMPLPVSLPRSREPETALPAPPPPVEEAVEEVLEAPPEPEVIAEAEPEVEIELEAEEELEIELAQEPEAAEEEIPAEALKSRPEFELLEMPVPSEGEEPVLEVIPQASKQGRGEPGAPPPPETAEPEVTFELAEQKPGEELDIVEAPELELVESKAAADEGEELTAGPPEEDKLVPESRGLSVDLYDLTELSDEEREKHEKAVRFARLLVSEIKLYNEETVQLGRENADIMPRLRDDIERSRQLYNERIAESVREKADYFQRELVRQLADGNESLLGK